MGLFKSREARRIDREIEIRKGINAVKRAIRDLERNEREYIRKAKRSRAIGADDQLAFLKKTLKRTASQRRLLERQLLAIETGQQIKDQAEAHARFARAMNAVSRSIADLFGATDLSRTQRDFEEAMVKAETMEKRMEVFLDATTASMFGETTASDELVTDEEIDRMVDEELAADEEGGLDEEIRKGLGEIERELGKDR
ncbi:MAG: hypothetical protein JXP34_03815 [Planctomycetes bacterium]|nr:hypothetical protein [Planctomycetota bacterium]